MYSLIWAAELVTVRAGPKTSNPHLDATEQPGQHIPPESMTGGVLRVITKNFVADVVLLDKVTEQLLVGTTSVRDLIKRERATVRS